MTITMLAFAFAFVLLLVLLVATRRHRPGQRGHGTTISGESGATFPAYLGSDPSHCSGADAGGCDGGSGGD